MKSLPLFHRIAGQPVIVLGSGDAAQAKRHLVERAGGLVIGDMAEGIGKGVRLAFVAHDDAAMTEADTASLRRAGVLVNAVDRPDICDFTTPSVLDRDPVLIAIGTGGASAGLAKALRLRLERILPQSLGRLADALFAARDRLRARYPDAGARRRALDAALGEGGALDPLREDATDGIEDWLDAAHQASPAGVTEIVIMSDDPEDLTLRQARLLGSADCIVHDSSIPPGILSRARADAVRTPEPPRDPSGTGLTIIIRRR